MSDNDCSEQEDKTPGIFSWRDLMTGDVGASKEFYGTLLGWTTEDMEMPDGKVYSFFMAGDRPVGGMAELGEGGQPGWVNYVTVEDLDATIAKAQELGATVCVPRVDLPGKGSFAGVVDPQGVMISFWQFAE